MALDPNLSKQEEAHVEPTDSPSRTARRPWIARWSSAATMVAFTAIAAVISYNDGLFLIRVAGAVGWVAFLYPLLPDGLILISSIRLYRAAPQRPGWAMAGVIIGIALTLAMNVGAGVLHNWMYALADACVPVVFFVALEILRGAVKRVKAVPGALPDPAASVELEPDIEPAEPLTPDAALLALIGTGSRQAIADMLGVPKSRVNRWHARLKPASQDGPEEAEAEAAEATADEYWAAEEEPARYAFTAVNGSGPDGAA